MALLAAMRLDGITASFLVDGATDRQVFDTCVEPVLEPTLRPGQGLVWENLNVHKNAHKSSRAQAAFAAAGCEVVFQSEYLPDYNPIEQAFSEVNSGLR